MVHISDVCTAYEAAYGLLSTNDDVKNEIFGVMTGTQYTLKYIISVYEQKIGKKLNVHFGGKSYKEREVMIPFEHYKVLPNWKSKISLEEGLELLSSQL